MKSFFNYTAIGVLLMWGGMDLFLSQTFGQVSSVSPAPQIINASRNVPISVTFSSAIDPQTISNFSFWAFGRWSGVMGGTFSFENNNTKVNFSPSQSFSGGEYVTVYLSNDITDMNGNSLGGYAWSFWIKAEPNSLELQEIDRVEVRQPGEGPIQTYGAYAGDMNGDGFTDYCVPNELSNDLRVFLNDGLGGYQNFTVHPLPNGAVPSANEGSDFNRDGFIDLSVGNTGNNMVTVFIGDGSGGFQSINSYPASNQIRGITVLDAQGDGYQDIVSANFGGNNLTLLPNNGDGTFGAAIPLETTGNGERAVAAADANNDGIMDLFVGAFTSQEMIIMLGNSNGGFQFSDSRALNGTPWMIATGDVDGDGNVDVASVNSSNNTISVVLGNGNGGFSSQFTYASGGTFPIAIDLGDLDGDGDLDMMSSNFGNFGSNDGVWRLFENDGSGIFTIHQIYPASKAASCIVFHDRDNDGDLDVTGIDELDDLLFIFQSLPNSITNRPGFTPPDFALFQNFPNPFNPVTNIDYYLPYSGLATVKIFNIQGQHVRTLINKEMPIGRYNVKWDGLDFLGNPAASGLYFYRLEARGIRKSKKMILLR